MFAPLGVLQVRQHPKLSTKCLSVKGSCPVFMFYYRTKNQGGGGFSLNFHVFSRHVQRSNDNKNMRQYKKAVCCITRKNPNLVCTYSGIPLSPSCANYFSIKCVGMQDEYVDLQKSCVYMQHNYVDNQENSINYVLLALTISKISNIAHM